MRTIGRISSKLPNDGQTTVEKVAAQRTVCKMLVQAHLFGLAVFEPHELEAIEKMRRHPGVWPDYLKGVLSKMIDRINDVERKA